jgi:hypothetical protein
MCVLTWYRAGELADDNVLSIEIFYMSLRLYGYQPIFKESKTDPAAGITMGALAVLPSNKCGAHETFHDWSIPSYAATYVVPSVSRAFLWAFLWAFLERF